MANELYENIPELGAQEQAILRRRRIAEAMIARGQQPLETSQMVGNVVAPVSWTQGLAQLANAYLGGKQARESDKEYGGLADKRRQMVADEMAKITALQNGQAGVEGIQAQPERTIQAPAPMQEGQIAPNFNTVPEQIPAVQGRAAVPAVAQDKSGAITQALMSNLPEMQRYGTTMQANEVRNQDQAFKTQEAQSTRTDKAEQKQLDRENKIEVLKEQIRSREMMGQQSNDLKAAMANLMADTRLETTRLAASLRPQSSVTPVTIADPQDPNKTIVIDGRTGRVFGSGPKLTDSGKQESKKQMATEQDKRSALKALSAAGYDPSTGKDAISDLIKKSTSGWVQKNAAEGLASVNVTTSGRKALNTLNSAANQIVMQMMGGKLGSGISNADRDFVVGQLGDVGNANKTADERLAAWTYAKNRMTDIGMLPEAGALNVPSSGLSQQEESELNQLRQRFKK